MPTWDDVVEELASRLSRLRTGDAITLQSGRYWVQFKQFNSDLAVITQSASIRWSEQDRLDAARDAALARLGWNSPEADTEHTRSLDRLSRPISADTSRTVAVMLVTTLREVYDAQAPSHVTLTSFNDHGQRAPVLTTVSMDPTQVPESRVEPRKELPDASPQWRTALDVLAVGLGTWSRSDVDALLARGGWEVTADEGWSLKAAGDGLTVSALKTGSAGARSGFGEFRQVTFREEVTPPSASVAYRAALAAAVDVLGDPPLVGGPDAIAIWRGHVDTVTLSRKLFSDRSVISCTVTPTAASEAETDSSAEWLEDWRPEYRWLTEPDIEAPEAKTLLGMMSYSHPPAANLNALGDDLRGLFGSLTADLQLLYPYASDVQWAVVRPNSERLAAGRFTPQRAEIRCGNGPADRSALDGRRTGEQMAQRLMAILVEAGVQRPDQVRGRMWSGTPAERVAAGGWTISGR